jgi:hypothetical protein
MLEKQQNLFFIENNWVGLHNELAILILRFLI